MHVNHGNLPAAVEICMHQHGEISVATSQTGYNSIPNPPGCLYGVIPEIAIDGTHAYGPDDFAIRVDAVAEGGGRNTPAVLVGLPSPGCPGRDLGPSSWQRGRARLPGLQLTPRRPRRWAIERAELSFELRSFMRCCLSPAGPAARRAVTGKPKRHSAAVEA